MSSLEWCVVVFTLVLSTWALANIYIYHKDKQ